MLVSAPPSQPTRHSKTQAGKSKPQVLPKTAQKRSACQRSVGLPIQPSSVTQEAFTQLSDHVRSLLISLLSYELQTPLSTIQVAVEILFEDSDIAFQDKHRLLDLAQHELQQLCQAVEAFLSYATEIWSMTQDLITFQSAQEAEAYLTAMFAALPEVLEGHQPWMVSAQKRLTPFLEALCNIGEEATEPIASQQYALFENRHRQLLAIVNHELRTPFSSLQVCLETLQEEETLSPHDRQMLLEVAIDDLKRLCNLVRDLEILGRLEAGQVCFQNGPVDITATLHSTVSSIQAQHLGKPLSNISVESPASFPEVWIDGDRLTEVFKRVLENACRFTPEQGDIKVQVLMTPALSKSHQDNAPEKKSLIVRIADTGRGIQVNQLERIFDCFYQEEGYLQRTRGGVGIGLTICRHLIQGMGGKIWAKSSGQHRGSQFYFKIPVQTQSASHMAYSS